MDKRNQDEILKKSKEFFKENIASRHLKNTKGLNKLSAFNSNPFLTSYIANFAFGDDSEINIAKALVYPRVFGTSINTTFGTQMQNYCNEVFNSLGSLIPGIDIEFVDALDGRRKYCQIKAGPNTINHDDVDTICSHFSSVKNLARTNKVQLNPTIDCVVATLYGDEQSLSEHYKRIDREYAVLPGATFWYHLTGNSKFFDELVNAFSDVASEYNAKDILDQIIEELAEDIKRTRRGD